MAKISRRLITVVFIIRQSSILIYGLILLHLTAVIAALCNGLDFGVRLGVGALILASLFYYLKRELRFQSIFIRHGPINGWEIAYSAGRYIAVDILPSTVVSPYLVILHFKQTDKLKQTIFILKDALMGDEYRKLMVQLKILGLKNTK